MSEKQKQLVDDILTASQQLPPERQYQLLGVAQGLSLNSEASDVENRGAVSAEKEV